MLLTRAGSGMVICVPIGNANKNASGFREKNIDKYGEGIAELACAAIEVYCRK